MRHRNHSLRLAQKPHHAWMIERNLLTSVLLYERIRTTKKRAQVVRPLIDRVITMGKTDRKDLAIRRINKFVTDPNACLKILEVLKERYAKRPGGFTRMVPVGMRKGDGALLVDLILVGEGDAIGAKKEPRGPGEPKGPKKKSGVSSKQS